jgi:hypothetical protein
MLQLHPTEITADRGHLIEPFELVLSEVPGQILGSIISLCAPIN